MLVTWDSLGGAGKVPLDLNLFSVRKQTLCTASNADGRLEVFASGLDGAIWHLWQTAPGTWAPPGAWTSRSSPAGGLNNVVGFAVARNADGRLEIFAFGRDGGIHHTWQTKPNNGWSAWASRGHPPATSFVALPSSHLAVHPNADGRLEVFAAASDGAVWHAWQMSPNGGWIGATAWSSRGRPDGVALSEPAVGQNADGRLELFAAGDDGRIHHTWQRARNDGWVSLWANRGQPQGVRLSRPAVRRNADGCLELLAPGDDGTLWHTRQVTANNGWLSTWNAFPKPGAGVFAGPVIQVNADGRLEVFVASAGSAIYHIWETSPGKGWASAWSSLEGVRSPDPYFLLIREPSVAVSAAGTLDVFGVSNRGDIVHTAQRLPNDGWNTRPVGFATDIRPLFRNYDVAEMRPKGIDLSSYADVKHHAASIYQVVDAGSMPCNLDENGNVDPTVQWSASRVALFKRWMDEGMAP